ncbi:MAG: right-handed parallel beta-helix repeat-containing protein, partial [Thermoplasmata archaeon]|nr:right-handed parallel beta-helix repeat-containing protein [Thermoplasmata archaeon]
MRGVIILRRGMKDFQKIVSIALICILLIGVASSTPMTRSLSANPESGIWLETSTESSKEITSTWVFDFEEQDANWSLYVDDPADSDCTFANSNITLSSYYNGDDSLYSFNQEFYKTSYLNISLDSINSFLYDECVYSGIVLTDNITSPLDGDWIYIGHRGWYVPLSFLKGFWIGTKADGELYSSVWGSGVNYWEGSGTYSTSELQITYNGTHLSVTRNSNIIGNWPITFSPSKYQLALWTRGPGHNDGIGTSTTLVLDRLTIETTGLLPHLPIRINSNTDFDAAHGVSGGNGTKADPWIIENYDIDGSGYSSCLYVGNTTHYFIVRNCYLHEASGVNSWPSYPNASITFYNVRNGSMVNNEISLNSQNGAYISISNNNRIVNNIINSNNASGIYIYRSPDNYISNNTITLNNHSGITLDHSSQNCIANNNLNLNNMHGIYIYYSGVNEISNNTASSNMKSGINVWYSNNNTIENNTASFNNNWGARLDYSNNNSINDNTVYSNNYDGIFLSNSYNNTITNGNLYLNALGGIHISNSNNNRITNNIGHFNNRSGIQISMSSNNILANNIVYSNNYHGIHIYPQSSNNSIVNNTAYLHNNSGICIDSSDNNTITQCNVWNNQYGIYVSQSISQSTNNTIYYNNLINNTNQAYDEGINFWNNTHPIGGNYWSDYTGIDIYSGVSQDQPGNDGIGDTPYIIDGGSQDNYPFMKSNGWLLGLAESPWPMFRCNPQHTGQSSYNTTHVRGLVSWNFTIGDFVRSSPSINPDGTIYIGSNDGKLYALYPNGTEKWNFSAGDNVASSPAIASDGTIYFGCYPDKIYALNSNGTEKWNYSTGSGYMTSSPAIGLDGVIYIGSGGGGSSGNDLFALYPNGTKFWNFSTGGNIVSSPSIDSIGTIYVGSNDGYLYALYPNGTLKWKFHTGFGASGGPAIGTDGTIYVGTNKLYAIYPNGTLKWSFNLGSDRWVYDSSPAISADGTIYIGT